ncbi:hypothetical protein ABZ439_25780 [Streptomyces sp. NPDC005840]|uniref:hypothetical protein n=1 Tax=Streptomyces sp. NPDC005840 TaxID=3157072 RepID=UPI0033D2A230
MLVTVVGLYVSALFSQNPLPRPDAATVGYTLLTSFVATLTFGLIGAHWYATRPVDVTSRIAWPKDLDNPSTATATRAALAVPGSLKRLSIRVHLQDMRPSVGNCSGSTFDVQRIGDSQPTKRVLSDHTVEVRIPNGVRRLVITLTVHPDTECTMAAFIESAVFHQE